MGGVKKNCSYIPRQCKTFRLSGAHPDWEMHPSWIAGVEALDAYNHWVCEVVLPIAFQWIEEHKADVYANVADGCADDVGVVIAAAFDLVKNLPAYQTGLETSAAYEAALADRSWDPTTINPIWTEIVQAVRDATQQTFAEQAAFLKDTIR